MSSDGVLISGATGGIGEATVGRFLDSGYTVLAIDQRRAEREDDRLRAAIADVRDPAAVAAAIEELTDGIELRHVVCLAGAVLPREPEIVQMPAAEAAELFRATLELNLIGQFNLVLASLTRLKATSGDRSITLCSTVNALGDFGGPAYSAAKAGLIGMMHALASPLGRDGIRINTIAPGTTRTPAWGQLLDDDQLFERLAAETHLKRGRRG